MKKANCLKAAAVALVCLAPSSAFTDTWTSKVVGNLQGLELGTECMYFTLEGVTQADPVKPGGPWFAMLRTTSGAKDAYAMLLAAKLSGQAVNVATNGTLTCNHATARAVWM